MTVVEKDYSLIELLTFLHINIFGFTYIFLRVEVFDFFMLQHQKITCSAKNVIKQSGKGLHYCQLFLMQVRTMKK